MKTILARLTFLLPIIFVCACNTTTASVEDSLTTGSISTGVAVGAGHASWYGPGFQGRRTASGEAFSAGAMTAAHRSLPFGTRVKVVHEQSGRSVVVRINDRGPFHRGRVIDLARQPAEVLGITAEGSAYVSLHRLD